MDQPTGSPTYPPSIITDQDMHAQIKQVLRSRAADYDVKGIAGDIIGRRGRPVDIDTLTPEYFWGVVARYDVTGNGSTEQVFDTAGRPVPAVLPPAPDRVRVMDPCDPRSGGDAAECRNPGHMHTPQPGPIWTNGMAPAAPPVFPLPEGVVTLIEDGHPAWCDQQHQRTEPSGVARHHLELLSLAVQDADLTTDVPLTVALERTDDPDDGPGETRTVLTIGHQLYQPTEVVLSASDRARLAAALLTAQALERIDR